MNHYEIIRKLIGAIEPVGESHIDQERFLSLKETCELVDSLVLDIYRVAQEADRHEGSISRAGEYAKDFLDELKESY